MAGKQAEETVLPTAARNDANAKNAAEEKTKKRQRTIDGLLVIPTLLYRRAFYMYTWDPIRKIRQTEEADRDFILIVKAFVEDKYAELQSVQVAASFCAGAAMSTLPWCKEATAHWSVSALWYSALICAITAIITSIQMKPILDDLPDMDKTTSIVLPANEKTLMRREILRYTETPGYKHWFMVFIWQFPSMMLANAWALYLCGLTVYVCTPWVRREPFGDEQRAAVVYLSIAACCLLTYAFATLLVYSGESRLIHSVTSSPATSVEELRPNSSPPANALGTSQTESSIVRNLRKEKKRQLMF